MESRNVWLIFYLFIALEFIMVWSFFLHNYYSNNPNWFNGLISPTSESVWEYIKLVVYPFLVVFLVMMALFSYWGRIINGPLALLIATLVGVITLIIVHYMIEEVSSPKDLMSMIVNHIINLLVAVILGLIFMYILLTGKDHGAMKNRIGLGIYIAFIILISIWSFWKPCNCWIWENPQIGSTY